MREMANMNTVAAIGLNRHVKDTITTRVIGITQIVDTDGMKAAGTKVLPMAVANIVIRLICCNC